jgi:hypothetical protein
MLLGSSWNSGEQCLKLNHHPPTRQILTQRHLIPTTAVAMVPVMILHQVPQETRLTTDDDGGVLTIADVAERHQ